MASLPDPYVERIKPDLGPRLAALGLLVEYHRGDRDFLYYRDASGHEVEVLDLVGGYGANLLGHANPEVREALTEALDQGLPFTVQGSRRAEVARVADRLGKLFAARLGRQYRFIFSNTGSEAVNTALYHAHVEFKAKGRTDPVVLMLAGGYHGVLTHVVGKRGFPGPALEKVEPDDLAGLEAAAGRLGPRLMAVLFETIQGEGGVRPLSKAYVEALARVAKDAGVPLIVDEVQTGSGRTGEILDCFHLGVSPDVIVMGKALGGGLTKLGLTCIAAERWSKDFDLHSLTTFAEDGLSGLAAERTLDILTRAQGAVLAEIRRKGAELLELLEGVRAANPDVIQAVRGRGLMVGVEFHPWTDNPSHAMSTLSESAMLGQFLAAYLLKSARIRIAPTLSAPRVLRLEPSYRIRREDMERFAAALAHLCTAIRAGDCAYMARYLLDRPVELETQPPPKPHPKLALIDPLPPGIPKVAFLGHFILPEHVALWDPSFERFTFEERDQFLQKFARFLDPKLYRVIHIRSRAGAEVGYVFIGMAQTSGIYADAWRAKDVGWLQEKIDKALDTARAFGCSVVGFGGFNSIVTDNCRSVEAPDLALTTGNAFTAGAGIQAIEDEARRLGIELGRATLGVVGALGNIASVYTQAMLPRVGALVLVGRPGSERRLGRMRDDKLPEALHGKVRIATDMAALTGCDLILTATNSARPVILPEHIDPGRPVVVCDIAVPADCSPELARLPRCTVIRGGIIHPVGNDHIHFPGIPLARGEMYACMAETALLGLEGIRENFSYGPISVEQVERIRALAAKHGFVLQRAKVEPSI